MSEYTKFASTMDEIIQTIKPPHRSSLEIELAELHPLRLFKELVVVRELRFKPVGHILVGTLLALAHQLHTLVFLHQFNTIGHAGDVLEHQRVGQLLLASLGLTNLHDHARDSVAQIEELRAFDAINVAGLFGIFLSYSRNTDP